eukprot:TRINITY_DN7278_c0_g1_i3.p1 TRINITY_DN7278_c0_g1~~TRINITY_DN7278_c0_g1_i3.p1  ORF type:complete len:280 (+),score=23.09 TRINITY_DN7278_c0_g1_i3:29-868(+)
MFGDHLGVPIEISLLILSYLDPEELCRVARVSRLWYRICGNDFLWKGRCLEFDWTDPTIVSELMKQEQDFVSRVSQKASINSPSLFKRLKNILSKKKKTERSRSKSLSSIEVPQENRVLDSLTSDDQWRRLFTFQYPRRKTCWTATVQRMGRQLISIYRFPQFQQVDQIASMLRWNDNNSVTLIRTPYICLLASAAFEEGSHFVEARLDWDDHYTGIGIVDSTYKQYQECLWLNALDSCSWVSIGSLYKDRRCVEAAQDTFKSGDEIGVLIHFPTAALS